MNEFLMYETQLETLMEELIALKLEGDVATCPSHWEDIFENLKLCHRWLARWEAGEIYEDWQTEIEFGLQAAREDLNALKA